MKLLTLLCSLFLFANSALALSLRCPHPEQMLSAEFFKAVKGPYMWAVYSKPFAAYQIEWSLHMYFPLAEAQTPEEAIEIAKMNIANEKIDFDYERPKENAHHINICSKIRNFGELHLYAFTPPSVS